MNKGIYDFINEAIVYASILSGIEHIIDECKNFKCADCKFLSENKYCMFYRTPKNWDLDDIEKALKGE